MTAVKTPRTYTHTRQAWMVYTGLAGEHELVDPQDYGDAPRPIGDGVSDRVMSSWERPHVTPNGDLLFGRMGYQGELEDVAVAYARGTWLKVVEVWLETERTSWL